MARVWNVFSRSCPSRTSLAQIANKWTAMIVISLSEKPSRFSELRERVDGISNKVLTDTLRSLERDGMVARRQQEKHSVYELTALGRTLDSPLRALQEWAEGHIEEVIVARDRYDERVDAEILGSNPSVTEPVRR
jgi:DNA-binding HxlR family transcriptional regulator